MADAWEEIQAVKSKRNELREKLEKRKREREGLLNHQINTNSVLRDLRSPSSRDDPSPDDIRVDPEVEAALLRHLSDVTLPLPVSSLTLTETMKKQLSRNISNQLITNILLKFSTQLLITVREIGKEKIVEVTATDESKLLPMVDDLGDEKKRKNPFGDFIRRKTIDSLSSLNEEDAGDDESVADRKEIGQDDILSLISMPTIKEKESKKVGEEIMELLSKPTAKERSLAERFRSQGGATVMEFCPHGTKVECLKNSKDECKKLHFKKIIQTHTDETLGDCSFLNTCFHMDTCKYVHYEVDGPKGMTKEGRIDPSMCGAAERSGTVLYPAQWIQCDLRYIDMSVLGKFAVIMADPPWDIHMELPYGTMSDDEMRQLGIPQLQDDGLIFLWVTGRAMELGRECLNLWGYERVDEIIWVKTNQLQRIIRTGRTGHWLNHGKEHCLVGLKGSPPNLNRGLDCDVIVAEVRATSHKPDEIYGIIERLSPGTRKIELFGRPHNVQPNWITLGNQVDGIRLVDPELIEAFRVTYPDGNCMGPSQKVT